VLSLVLGLASVVLCLISRALRRTRLSDEAWAKTAERAVGSVEVRDGTNPMSKNRHPSESSEVDSTVRVTFRAKDRALYSFQPLSSRLEDGQSVEVLYDGGSPSTATLARPPRGPMAERLACALSGMLIVAALMNYVTAAR